MEYVPEVALLLPLWGEGGRNESVYECDGGPAALKQIADRSGSIDEIKACARAAAAELAARVSRGDAMAPVQIDTDFE